MTKYVMRHSLTVRLNHWAVAISGIMLLLSGFGEMPMAKRYNIVKVPGLAWTESFETMLVLHYIFAFIFVAGCIFHVVYHYRRREFECMPKKGDVKESIHIIKCIVMGKEEPPHGKFLAEQRLAYIAIAVASCLLIVTGLIKTYKNMGPIILPPKFLFVVTYTHTMMTMLFMLLLIAHVGAFALKANWPLFPSMITGRVKKEYAECRHPEWNCPKK